MNDSNENNRTVREIPSSKDWKEDFAHENGNYMCTCMYCKETFFGYKRRVICKECDAKLPFPTDKKTTAEDILEKHTGETGIYLTKGMVRGSEALEAMEEYATLRIAELREDGWRQCAKGQKTSQFCSYAESFMKELLSKAGKGLPDNCGKMASQILSKLDESGEVGNWTRINWLAEGLIEMRSIAADLLLASDLEIERLKNEALTNYQKCLDASETIERLRKELEEAKNRFQDNEADGLVFCGKCGKLNNL